MDNFHFVHKFINSMDKNYPGSKDIHRDICNIRSHPLFTIVASKLIMDYNVSWAYEVARHAYSDMEKAVIYGGRHAHSGILEFR